MSFITTKFHAILFSLVSVELCWPTVHFRQISKFKKSLIQRKKGNQNFLRICTSTHYVLHYYKVSGNSVEWFQRSCENKKTVVSFILAKFLSSKRALLPEKKWIKMSCGYAHLHITYFISTKFQEILLRGFRGVALTRQEAHGPHCSPEKTVQINKHIR